MRPSGSIFLAKNSVTLGSYFFQKKILGPLGPIFLEKNSGTFGSYFFLEKKKKSDTLGSCFFFSKKFEDPCVLFFLLEKRIEDPWVLFFFSDKDLDNFGSNIFFFKKRLVVPLYISTHSIVIPRQKYVICLRVFATHILFIPSPFYFCFSYIELSFARITANLKIHLNTCYPPKSMEADEENAKGGG